MGKVEKIQLLPSNEHIHHIGSNIFADYHSLKVISVEYSDICDLIGSNVFKKFSVIGCKIPDAVIGQKEVRILMMQTFYFLIFKGN